MITREMLTKRLPNVDNVDPDTQWVWFSVQVLMNLPAADAFGRTLSEDDDKLWEKRNDPGFQRLMDSIESDGFFDPVYVGDGEYDAWEYAHNSKHGLGNGHHRVVAALDLGYTHIPVTLDEGACWECNGPVTDTRSEWD